VRDQAEKIVFATKDFLIGMKEQICRELTWKNPKRNRKKEGGRFSS
jgi:hypothetical protein